MAMLALGLAVAIPAASAAESRYSQWKDPNATAADTAPADDLDSLLERLRTLVDSATQSQAADPRFLQDLRDLIADYEKPAKQLVVSDTFADGDYTHDPAWQVLQGQYWVEKTWGLRNKLVAPSAATGESKPMSREQKALRVLGAILQGGASNNDAPAANQDTAAKGNAIALPATIPNAFSIETKLTSWRTAGHLELGVYQGSDHEAGYRIVYEPGTPLRLVRVSSRGENTVDQSLQPVIMEDKKSHAVTLDRAADGTMTVTFDGEDLIKVVDKSFKDPFDGVRLSDQGGDFILGSIKVWALK